MKIKILWPGKTENKELKSLGKFYLDRINQMIDCQVIETKEVKGIKEKFIEKIKQKEAEGLEKYIKDNYIICLTDRGKEMTSNEFAQFLGKLSQTSPKGIIFIVGGFAGLSEKIIEQADYLLSLSKMTFSHELTRVVLLEQIYRGISILRRRKYAK
ncbi:MAG: 23S rRNA (pseudouridine(1915)-N(3))-methyltransferase RlmH [Candidatus Aminicenantia bacterium]